MPDTLTIRTTDLPAAQSKTESFAGNRFSVQSRSGLHTTEALLIGQLCSQPCSPAHLLFTGNRTGTLAMVAASNYPEARITCHALDLHHARAIQRNFAANNIPSAFVHDAFVRCPFTPTAPGDARVRLACTMDIPEGGYDLAFFGAAFTTTTTEMILDQLEEIHERLAVGGTCFIAYEGKMRGLPKLIKNIFGNVFVRTDQKKQFCASAIKMGALQEPRTFYDNFRASIPQGQPMMLTSIPGVFSHRNNPDKGGLALAEVASRELRPRQRILDIGCGCGLVGILLAMQKEDAHVTFVDSCARALASTCYNLSTLAFTGYDLILSDTGLADTGVEEGSFDMVVGNPPYFSDWRIAQIFVDAAFDALRPGGIGFLIAKSPEGLHRCVKTRFEYTSVIERRGYSVIRFTQTHRKEKPPEAEHVKQPEPEKVKKPAAKKAKTPGAEKKKPRRTKKEKPHDTECEG